MSGPEAYKEALRLLNAEPGCQCPATGCVHERLQVARAQVLMTGALAAATALCQDGGHEATVRQWMEVAS